MFRDNRRGLFWAACCGCLITVTALIALPGASSGDSVIGYCSVPAEAFLPTGPSSYGSPACGGRYGEVGSIANLAASVQLPHGARITKFTAYCYDDSPSDLYFVLYANILGSCGYVNLAEARSSGMPEYDSVEVTVTSGIVDNSQYGYLIIATPTTSGTWDSELKVKGAVIEYEL